MFDFLGKCGRKTRWQKHPAERGINYTSDEGFRGADHEVETGTLNEGVGTEEGAKILSGTASRKDSRTWGTECVKTVAAISGLAS